MDMEGSVNSRINGGIQRYFTLFLTRENIQGPQQAKCIELFARIKKLSETVSDCLEVLERQKINEGRFALLDSAFKEFMATVLKPTQKIIEGITGKKE